MANRKEPMTSRPSRELLRSLALAAGAPGQEQEVRDVVRKSIGELGSISHDALGSILCECPGSAAEPRVVLGRSGAGSRPAHGELLRL